STRFSSLTRTSMPAASIADTKSDNDCCGMGIPLLRCCGDYWVTSCEDERKRQLSSSRSRASALGLGCVKTLRGMTAPGILRLVVTFRAKICRNLSSAQRYDQIRFRFYTAWVVKRLKSDVWIESALPR